MNVSVIYWLSVICSFCALALLAVNIGLIYENQHLQHNVAMRQATISQGVALSKTNEGLSEALAEIAVKNNDKEIRDLLAAQGITINTSRVAAPASDEKKK